MFQRDDRFDGDAGLRRMPIGTREDDAWLRAQFRYHSRTFSLACRLLPRPVRLPIAVVYQFCRSVDNVADQCLPERGPAAALTALEDVETSLRRTLAGNPPPALLWQRLAKIHARWTLDPIPFDELIEGARFDIEGRAVASREDLLHYCNLVGGSIGPMVLPFLVAPDADRLALDRSARDLGIAMQITNILRDVGEDRRDLGRCYLPQELLPDSLNAQSEPYRALVEDLMREAEDRYDRALGALDGLLPTARRGIRSAGRVYREILNEIRANAYDNLTRRAVVPFRRKSARILRDGYTARRNKLLGALRDGKRPAEPTHPS
jgi:phytoene synthase